MHSLFILVQVTQEAIDQAGMFHLADMDWRRCPGAAGDLTSVAEKVA